MQTYHLDIEDVELHREIPGSATECPGKLFPADSFRRRLRERISVGQSS
jgi:N-acetylmuramoyl-L-alanine amidase